MVAARGAFALAWALACAAAAALLVGAPAVAQLLFGWGRMDATALARIAQWGTTAAWGLLPQALIAVAMAVLASQRRLKPAVFAYAAALGALGVAAMPGSGRRRPADATAQPAVLRDRGGRPWPRWVPGPWQVAAVAPDGRVPGGLAAARRARRRAAPGRPPGRSGWRWRCCSRCWSMASTWAASAELRETLRR